MKQGSGDSRMDLDFQAPETGDYIFQIEEGITLFTNPNSGKTSLQIPCKVVECKGGQSEENIGLGVTHFVPIQTEFGEKQLAHILSITGLFEQFDRKFPGEDVNYMGDEFIGALKLKLVGKLFSGGVETKEKDGKKRSNFKYIERLTKGGAKSPPSGAGGAANSAGGKANTQSDW